MSEAVICPFCRESEATLLCDFVIGCYWDGEMQARGPMYPGQSYRVVSRDDAEVFICDRPICQECATHVGMMFAHGKGGSWSESEDHCPQCAGQERDGLNPISREEAKAARAQMWKRSNGLLRSLA
jgi:hypothetical protein